MYAQIPMGLNCSAIPYSQSARPRNAEKLCDHLRFIVSSVCDLTAKTDEAILHVHRGGVPLSSRILRRYCGMNYARALSALIDAGVLENVNYPKGYAYSSYTGKSKLYRLAEKWRGVTWAREEFGKLMSDKLEAWQREENEITELLHPEFLPLRECLDAVTFLADEAQQYVNAMPDYTEELVRKKNARADAVHRVRAIQEGTSILPFTYRENCGRLFHTYTNLPKDILPFLRARDGSELLEVDVANSQPFFAAACASADGVNCTSLDEAARGEFYELLMSKAQEHGQYREAVAHAILRVAQRKGEWVTIHNVFSYEREAFKTELLSNLYDAPERAVWAARRGVPGALSVIVADAFRRVFPELWEWVQSQKTSRRVGRELALRMQRAEGELILRSVALDILREHPGEAIITRHDSIICRAELAEEVQRRIHEASARLYGRSCTARIKTPGKG